MLALPAAAQSLEAEMKEAAGAYERKDFAAAVKIWRPLAEAGNAEARTLLGAMYWSGADSDAEAVTTIVYSMAPYFSSVATTFATVDSF